MTEESFIVSGQIADVVAGRFFPGEILVENGRISNITETEKAEKKFILPGLVDAHIHIESSMLPPAEFARLAVVHGTVATVSDPHEIANVAGTRGIDYMIANAAQSPFYFYFGAPSCVPATIFESSGAKIGPKEIEELLSRDEILYLSEMMNYPGVIFHDPDVLAKIETAKKRDKPIDGHAPGVTGEDLLKYAAAGISTDHECTTYEEGKEKIEAGMKILIREGSAAKNFNDLIELLREYPDKVMFCSDDKHPDDLVAGHINDLIRRAIMLDIDPMIAIRAATLNPAQHYRLSVGLLQKGDPADFITVNNLEDFTVKKTFIKGVLVAEKGKTLIEHAHSDIINHFDRLYINPEDIVLEAKSNHIRVIEALDEQLLTGHTVTEARIDNGFAVADPERDILKLVVVNRYKNVPPAVGFVSGFGLKSGAIASSVSHDSHNLIAVGADDVSIKRAINLLIQNKGGISLVNEFSEYDILPLPIAGLMSVEDGYKVAEDYDRLDAGAKSSGCTLKAPFMTLSFLALLVIPELKLSDKGLFDAKAFAFTDVFVD